MELSNLLDEHFGSSGTDFGPGGTGWKRIHDITGSESETNPLVATSFWQGVLGHDRFGVDIQRAGASPLALERGECVVVRHGGYDGRYDLVILDPGYVGEPKPVAIEYSDDELHDGWARYRRRWLADADDQRRTEGLIARYGLGPELAVEAARCADFRALLTGMPTVEYTSGVPSPPWQTLGPASGSAGVVAMDRQGRVGVTGSLHALGPAGTAVVVAGAPGTVVASDSITDSCFVEVDPTLCGGTVPSQGPLRGMTPRANEDVRFEGCTSQRIDTIVTGWSPELPFVHRGSQLKVLTKPETAPGDSGCALVDSTDHVLGFSFYRTGYGSKVEFAAWIWAESVFLGLDLT